MQVCNRLRTRFRAMFLDSLNKWRGYESHVFLGILLRTCRLVEHSSLDILKTAPVPNRLLSKVEQILAFSSSSGHHHAYQTLPRHQGGSEASHTLVSLSESAFYTAASFALAPYRWWSWFMSFCPSRSCWRIHVFYTHDIMGSLVT